MDQKLSPEARAEASNDLADILQDWGAVRSDFDQMAMDVAFDEERDAAAESALYRF